MNTEKVVSYSNPSLLWIVVPNKQMKHITEICRNHNVPIGTYLFADGVSDNKIIRTLGLDNVRREMAIIVGEYENNLNVLNQLDQEYKFSKAHSGYAFIVPLTRVIGTILYQSDVVLGMEEEENYMFEGIMTIVDRGVASTVIEVAHNAGAHGGSILHGRGTARDNAEKVFGMEIEPEKELVLIVVKKEDTKTITSAINNELGLEKPNTGILFTFPITDSRGV